MRVVGRGNSTTKDRKEEKSSVHLEAYSKLVGVQGKGRDKRWNRKIGPYHAQTSNYGNGIFI